MVALVVLLPFSYIPLEIVPSGPSISSAVVAFTLFVAFRHGAFRGRLGAMDAAVVAFGSLVVLRYLFGPVQVVPGVAAAGAVGQAMRDVGALVAGLGLFRLARQPELRPAIIRGLRASLAVILTMAAYQMAVGLPTLMGLGYLDPGWFYYTWDGSYRPFGPFLAPTVFGAYLAMIGSVVIWTAQSTRSTVLWLLAVTAGLYATQTRAAWLAFALAMFVTLLRSSPATRSRAAFASMFLVPGAAFLALAVPGVFSGFTTRLMSIGDMTSLSNGSRLRLWQATLDIVEESPVLGYGLAPFRQIVTPLVGPVVAKLGHPHSNYFLMLYLFGWLGLALFLTLLVVMARQLSGGRGDSYRLAAMAALIVFAVDSLMDATWTSVSVTSCLFLLVGLGAGSGDGGPDRPSANVESRAGGAVGARIEGSVGI